MSLAIRIVSKVTLVHLQRYSLRLIVYYLIAWSFLFQHWDDGMQPPTMLVRILDPKDCSYCIWRDRWSVSDLDVNIVQIGLSCTFELLGCRSCTAVH